MKYRIRISSPPSDVNDIRRRRRRPFPDPFRRRLTNDFSPVGVIQCYLLRYYCPGLFFETFFSAPTTSQAESGVFRKDFIPFFDSLALIGRT